MVEAISVCTKEIDDIDKAVEEILGQLKHIKLKKNTIGILTCHSDFVLSGTVKAICSKLSFHTIGTVTFAQAVKNKASVLLLSILVITSDDVNFSSALTPSLLGDPRKVITETYRGLQTNVKPEVIFIFSAFISENSNDEYVDVLTKESGGIPLFGTIAVDDTSDYSSAFMIYNGEEYHDRLGIVLLSGNINPKFYTASISKDKILDKTAVITSSNGRLIKEVNNRPLIDYFAELGLANAGEKNYDIFSLPFIIDYNDGTPKVSKVFLGFNENKEGVCAGEMPEGATLYIGMFNKEDVLFTTGETVNKALAENKNASLFLAFSCISRAVSLGSDVFAELNIIKEKVSTPFLAACSGGEICPTQINDTNAINRFHNNTFILCVI